MSFTTGRALPQTDPPRSPRETLPTMYDLPSEFPEEPGLPDEFHDLQPQLLSRTLSLADYSRYTRQLRYFKLVGSLYREQPLQDQNPLIWLDHLNIGLGLWQGEFEGVTHRWLRWCDQEGQWLLTDTEQAQQQAEGERQARQQAQKRSEKLAEILRELGIDPDEV